MIALTAYAVLLFLVALGATILVLIWIGKIDLSRLISEPNGDASMARFQLLIFTFVIASCFLLVVVGGERPTFPADIPQGVLLLLGISSSSYLVSKGIQFSSSEGVEDRPPMITVSPASATSGVSGPAVQFKATVIRSSNTDVKWSIDQPSYGTVDKNGLYQPPSVLPAGVASPIRETVRATSAADPAASTTATVIL